jgi:protein gp37
MGEQTAIQWPDATWNPVRGCTKISPGCANCYAETFSHRNPAVLGEWGPNGRRVVAAESAWKDPIKWAKKHLARVLAGEVEPRPFRIFCASLADIFEDHPVVLSVRERLWRETIPALDKIRLPDGRPAAVLLLLTKRAEIARAWYDANGCPDVVWPGVTAEDQKHADERIPVMLGLPRLWLSCEPLLSELNLRRYTQLRWSECVCSTGPTDNEVVYDRNDIPRCPRCHVALGGVPAPGISWVIVGGESGAYARPMQPEWASSLRDQCLNAGDKFLFKQWGAWAPELVTTMTEMYGEWTVRPIRTLVKVGKHAAGRLLDGRTWDEVPE